MPQQASTKSSRVRHQFTETEEDDLVEFLADYEPSARLTIFPYRKLADEPWGSNHSSDSWLSRYRRFQPIYDARIMGHILENELAEREQDGKDGKETPVKKKLGRSNRERSADPEPLQDLPIPLERFMKKPTPLSNEDQFISLNLAVRLLSEAHKVDPGVVYETWERTGDLMLTDAELRGQGGDDDDREIDNLQTHSDKSSDDERSETSTNSRKRKRSASADPSESDAGGPASPNPSPKKRVYGGRARRSDIVGVPSSQPGEESDSPSVASRRRIKTPPKNQRGDTEASESSQSSPTPEAPPPAPCNESDDEDSDSQSGTPAQPRPQPDNDAEEQSSEEESESESEAAQIASALSSPARPPPVSQGDAADESEEEEEEEEEEENEESESGSEAAPVASVLSSPARPPPTSQGDVADGSEEEEEEEEEEKEKANDSELSDAVPRTPPTKKSPAAADEDSTSESESDGEGDAQPVSPRSKRVHSSSRSSSESSERSKASIASQMNNSVADDSYIPTQKSLFG
ncbi:hypothetical protein DFH06DRAFT_511233 [Mycena polygramma]|nr:hypothetical protein DFH06DRAFT_511233 [Mycena polygramma]